MERENTGKTRNEMHIEALFTIIWCSIAQWQLHISEPELPRPAHLNSTEDISELCCYIFDKLGVDPAVLQCHTFDLNVIRRMFDLLGKPIKDSTLIKVVARLNEEVAKVGQLVVEERREAS